VGKENKNTSIQKRGGLRGEKKSKGHTREKGGQDDTHLICRKRRGIWGDYPSFPRKINKRFLPKL